MGPNGRDGKQPGGERFAPGHRALEVDTLKGTPEYLTCDKESAQAVSPRLVSSHSAHCSRYRALLAPVIAVRFSKRFPPPSASACSGVVLGLGLSFLIGRKNCGHQTYKVPRFRLELLLVVPPLYWVISMFGVVTGCCDLLFAVFVLRLFDFVEVRSVS